MRIHSRFGLIDVNADDVLRFPNGLWGLEQCCDWVLLADSHNSAVVWLQSMDRPEIAMPVASPRRFVPGYQIRVARRELAALELDDPAAARVLAIVGRTERGLSLNLKAPLVINLKRRLGRQVATNGDLPVRYELGNSGSAMRKTA
jgi:flagellar assembly factor FliW